MTLSPEDLEVMAEKFTQLRLNATNEEDAYQANLMCELIRLAQLGQALSSTGGNPGYFDIGCGGANGSH